MHQKATTRNSATPVRGHNEPCYHVPISHERTLALRLEPGSRPTPLYRLSLWTESGMVAGGFGGSARDVVEIFLALQQLHQMVDTQGLPGE